MHLDLNLDHILLAVFAGLVWLIRLEAKVKAIERDVDGIGAKFGYLSQALHQIELSQARVEVKLGIKEKESKDGSDSGEKSV